MFSAQNYGIDLLKVGIPKLSAESAIDRIRCLILELTVREVRMVLIVGILHISLHLMDAKLTMKSPRYVAGVFPTQVPQSGFPCGLGLKPRAIREWGCSIRASAPSLAYLILPYRATSIIYSDRMVSIDSGSTSSGTMEEELIR